MRSHQAVAEVNEYNRTRAVVAASRQLGRLSGFVSPDESRACVAKKARPASIQKQSNCVRVSTWSLGRRVPRRVCSSFGRHFDLGAWVFHGGGGATDNFSRFTTVKGVFGRFRQAGVIGS